MLTYSFSDIGTDSLYGHLYKCIKKDILSGVLRPDEKLPSKRSFAKNLGISVITVENAYEQLLAEGFIYSIPKKGFYTADVTKTSNTFERPVPPEALKLPLTQNNYITDFSSNSPVLELFPFTVWAKLLRECLRDYQEDLLLSFPSGGSIQLRNAIANHLFEFRGLNVSPEQIIIGAGTEYLYGQIVQLLGHDKVYGIEDPGYSKIANVYQANSVNYKYIALDKSGIKIDELEENAVDIAHTSPSHQFPTGIVTPIARRYELLSWAAKASGRYIIEDDYDSEFRMTGQPIPTLKSIDTIERVIYMNTFSKSISPTLRISYMVLPHHLSELYYKKLSFYSCPVTSMIQLTLARFLDEGYFEKHINRMRNHYRKHRDILLDKLKNSPVSSHIKISEEDSGLHFIIYLDITCTDEEFKKRLLNRNIRISPLSEYFKNTEKTSEHAFVINYSSLTHENIEEAISILLEEIEAFT